MLTPAKVKIGGEELKKIEEFTMDTDIPEEIIDKLCSIGCTSFVMSGKKIAQLIESKGDKKMVDLKHYIKLCPFCGRRLYGTERRDEYIHEITPDCILSNFRVTNIELWNKRSSAKSNLRSHGAKMDGKEE